MNVEEAAKLTLTRMITTNALSSRWPLAGPLCFEHVRGMLGQIIAGQVQAMKAHRWLGWAQCALVAAGAGTLDDMKEINRRSKTAEAPAGPRWMKSLQLRADLRELLNRHSVENGSNTPDFILVEYLMDCLAIYDKAVRMRADWYGRLDSPGQSDDGVAPRPPEGCKLTAHHTGDGWLLAVETHDLGDIVAYLDWPESWPETMTGKQLKVFGFEVV